MVALSAQKRTGNNNNNKWALPAGLLLILVLGYVILLPDEHYHDEESSLGLQNVVNSLDGGGGSRTKASSSSSSSSIRRPAPRPPAPPRIFEEAPSIQCDQFLDDVRHNRTSSQAAAADIAVAVDDTNQQKVFTKYMTKYDPPFWISIPVDDEHLKAMKVDQQTFGKGIYGPDRFDDVERFQSILQKSKSGNENNAPLIFWNLQDWGWYPLLSASKGRQAYLMMPQPSNNLVHTIRLCEAARMNRWTPKDSSGSSRDGVFPIYSHASATATTISKEWRERQGYSVEIFKLEGSDLSKSIDDARDLLTGLKINYLWLEWKTEDSQGNDPKQMLDQISKLGGGHLFKPWWPAKNEYDNFVQARCTASCSLWWKGTGK